MPLLSFIIPCYNKKPELQALLYTIYYSGLNKSEYEVIVSDDSDNDNIVDDIVELVDYYKGYMDIEYYTNRFPKVGPAANRENGLIYAKGKWVTFIDHDDVIIHKSFSDDFKSILKEENCAYINTSVYVVDDIKNIEFIESSESYRKILTHGKIYSRQFLIDNAINYDITAPAHEDIYFNYWVYSAMIATGNRCVDLTTDNRFIFYRFRVYNDSLSKTINFFDEYITNNPTWFLKKFYKPLEYVEKNQDIIDDIFDYISNELCYAVIMYLMTIKWDKMTQESRLLYKDIFDKCRLVLHNKLDKESVAKISTNVLQENGLLAKDIDDIIDYYSIIGYLL